MHGNAQARAASAKKTARDRRHAARNRGGRGKRGKKTPNGRARFSTPGNARERLRLAEAAREGNTRADISALRLSQRRARERKARTSMDHPWGVAAFQMQNLKVARLGKRTANLKEEDEFGDMLANWPDLLDAKPEQPLRDDYDTQPEFEAAEKEFLIECQQWYKDREEEAAATTAPATPAGGKTKLSSQVRKETPAMKKRKERHREEWKQVIKAPVGIGTDWNRNDAGASTLNELLGEAYRNPDDPPRSKEEWIWTVENICLFPERLLYLTQALKMTRDSHLSLLKFYGTESSKEKADGMRGVEMEILQYVRDICVTTFAVCKIYTQLLNELGEESGVEVGDTEAPKLKKVRGVLGNTTLFNKKLQFESAGALSDNQAWIIQAALDWMMDTNVAWESAVAKTMIRLLHNKLRELLVHGLKVKESDRLKVSACQFAKIIDDAFVFNLKHNYDVVMGVPMGQPSGSADTTGQTPATPRRKLAFKDDTMQQKKADQRRATETAKWLRRRPTNSDLDKVEKGLATDRIAEQADKGATRFIPRGSPKIFFFGDKIQFLNPTTREYMFEGKTFVVVDLGSIVFGPPLPGQLPVGTVVRVIERGEVSMYFQAFRTALANDISVRLDNEYFSDLEKARTASYLTLHEKKDGTGEGYIQRTARSTLIDSKTRQRQRFAVQDPRLLLGAGRFPLGTYYYNHQTSL